MDISALLADVAAGRVDVSEAERQLRVEFSDNLDFANIDHGRDGRTGFIEVVYCENKTPEQAATILQKQSERHTALLATRARAEHALAVQRAVPGLEYFPDAKVLRRLDPKRRVDAAPIAVVSAGTSDLPISEEAALTIEAVGHTPTRHYDVGVAGLHRVASLKEELNNCGCVIVVAGMEGALPSVVAGLISRPVIAVPTSVGYGVAWGGIAALMGMLAGCAPGVSVVNIDNGFGAAIAACRINVSINASK